MEIGAGLVVGVDFSEGSAAAVEEARSLAERLGLEPVFAHVIEDDPGVATPAEIDGWLTARGLERSAIRMLRGLAWIELGRCARQSASRLLVVGSHGRSGFQPLRPGRTATRLTLRSPIPVLVVPTGRRAAAAALPEGAEVEHDPEGFRRLEWSIGRERENQR